MSTRSGSLGPFVSASPRADQRDADTDRERQRAVRSNRLVGVRRAVGQGRGAGVTRCCGPEQLETGGEGLRIAAPVGVMVADEGAEG